MNARSLKTPQSAAMEVRVQDPPESAVSKAANLELETPTPEDLPLPTANTPEAIRSMIAEAAYFLAERRDFAPGCETEDWLNAEQEVFAALRS